MRDHMAFTNDIPAFMRRPRERAPARLEFPGRSRSGAPGAGSSARPPLPRPESVIHGGVPPVQPDFQVPAEAAPAQAAPEAQPAPDTPALLPWLARRKAPAARAPVTPAAASGVVDLTAHRGAAFESETAEPGTAGDAAFQVTLPRGVIRQIRVRAAEDGTTHRAIVLRALRAAGLDIPEGADVDRRATPAKRRQLA